MALLTKQRKQQQVLIGILVVVVLITAGVLLLGQREDERVVPPQTAGGSAIPRVPIPSDLFSDPAFLNLVPYDPITLPQTIGKDNPFN